jgi:hypothetical protein
LFSVPGAKLFNQYLILSLVGDCSKAIIAYCSKMKINLTIWHKLFIAAVFFAIAVAGFMMKLPSALRHFDKELHTAFYFLAAALLNILFANRHFVIFGLLYLFGMGIELSQEYSNKFFAAKIHGRYDPDDIRSNLKGLIAFSVLWFLYKLARFVFKKSALQQPQKNEVAE